MNSRRYWKNRLPFLLTNFVCMAALTVFLLVCGNSVSAVVLILIVWALILLSGLVLTYWKRKRQMEKLLDIAPMRSRTGRVETQCFASACVLGADQAG